MYDICPTLLYMVYISLIRAMLLLLLDSSCCTWTIHCIAIIHWDIGM